MKAIPPLLGLFAAAALFGAIQTSRRSTGLWNVELPIALGLQALTLAVASVRCHFQIKKKIPPASITIRSACTSLVVFAISMVAIWGGSLSLFDAFRLCNQEFLHWIPTSEYRSFSVPTNSMIIEYTVLGTISSAIGMFLFWYLFFRVPSQSSSESQSPVAHAGLNPYSPPNQAR